MATEVYIKFHGVDRTAAFEYGGFEFGCGRGVEDAFFLEELKAVGVEYFGPQIGVVARRVFVAA